MEFKQPTFNIDGYIFVDMFSNCLLSQYEVFENSKRIAYVRLRYGALSCSVPDARGSDIFYYKFEDGWKGDFADITERDLYLRKIIEEIKVQKR